MGAQDASFLHQGLNASLEEWAGGLKGDLLKEFKVLFVAVRALLQPHLVPRSPRSWHSKHNELKCTLFFLTTRPFHWLFPEPGTLAPSLVLQTSILTPLPQISLP